MADRVGRRWVSMAESGADARSPRPERLRRWSIAAVAMATLAVALPTSALAAETAPGGRPSGLPEGSVRVPVTFEELSFENDDGSSRTCLHAWIATFDERYTSPVVPPNPVTRRIFYQPVNPDGSPVGLGSVPLVQRTFDERATFAGYFSGLDVDFQTRDYSPRYSHLSGFIWERGRDERVCGEEWDAKVAAGQANMTYARYWTLEPVDPELVKPVVNSTGDGPATDPAVGGCDTGGTVNGAPECTLRAAIETVNESSEDEVLFDVAGAGVPRIVPGSALPALEVDGSIDGTSQPGGSVWVDLVGSDVANGITLDGSNTSVKGLVVTGATGIGISVEAGSGVMVEGNQVDVNPDGSVSAAGNSLGIASGVSATIRDNVVASHDGIAAIADVAGLVIEGNLVGVARDGHTAVGELNSGILATAPGAVVSNNTVRTDGGGLGIVVLGSGASGTSVTGNRVGAGLDGSELVGNGGSIRVDGVAGVTVSNNTVATTAEAAISTSGSPQWARTEAGGIEFRSVQNPLPADVTGGGTQIIGNNVGVLPSGAAATSKSAIGIIAWAGASNVKIDNNTVASVNGVGVQMNGGTGHTVTSNRIGTNAAGADLSVPKGVFLTETSGVVTVGTVGAGNTIRSTDTGVEVWSDGDDAESVIDGNSITGDDAGVVVYAAGTTVSNNTVTGSLLAIGAYGQAENVTITGGVIATLTANSIHGSAGLGIDAPGAPAAPKVIAVRTTQGGQARTTLIVFDMDDGAGKLEVFANDSCADPEARHVLGVTRERNEDEAFRIIQLGSTTRDHFTVTFTNSEGSTSELSPCADVETSPDSDGDGSVDAFDDLLGFGEDPTKAIVATDSEDLLLVSLTPGDSADARLSGVGTGTDPTPGSHPAGWSLPYGAISFRVEGLAEGGSASVGVTSITESKSIKGDSYWKYGPATAGADPSWYEFTADEDSGTGAVLTPAIDIPGVGIRRSFVLSFTDGARGDSDGGANGTITDPGGPVIFQTPDPTTTTTTTTAPPTTAPTTVTPTSTPSPTDPSPTTTPTAGPGPTVAGAEATAIPTAANSSSANSGSNASNLALTGDDIVGRILFALVLAVMGGLVILADRRRTRAIRTTRD